MKLTKIRQQIRRGPAAVVFVLLTCMLAGAGPAGKQKRWIPRDFHFPKDLIEDGEVPVAADWKELLAVNSDIIGYVYVEALPGISYPICQSADNDFYLHHNWRQESEYAGAIFADAVNMPDFTDPNTLLFGHNMRNGSMFGSLKFLYTENAIARSPYFWVLTPEGNYRYRIFSMFYTGVDSDVYLLYAWNGIEFYEWEEDIRRQSLYENEVPLYPWDKTVYMSTCTSDSEKRFVVFGKCVSSDRPYRPVSVFGPEEGVELEMPYTERVKMQWEAAAARIREEEARGTDALSEEGDHSEEPGIGAID